MTRSGTAGNLAAAAAAFRTTAAAYHPHDMFEYTEHIGQLPETFTDLAEGIKAMTVRAHQSLALDPGVVSVLGGLYHALLRCAPVAADILPVLQGAHRHDLDRRENPRPGEAGWNVESAGGQPSTSPGPAPVQPQQAVPTSSPEPPMTTSSPPNPDNAIRIDGGDDLDVVVTPYANGAVRLDLADHPDDPDPASPHVVLDQAGVAALADAGTVMEAAAATGRDEYVALDAKLRRLYRRQERIEDQRRAGRGAEYVALEAEFDDLTSRGDQLLVRQRERLALLAADEQAAFAALEDQLAAGADRHTVRAAQRRIIFAATHDEIAELYATGTPAERRRELRNRPGGLPDGDFGRRALFFNDQAEADKIADRKAQLRRQAQAIPQAPLSQKAETELARVKSEIKEAEDAIGEMTDWRKLAGGIIATPDGSGLAWQTVMVDDGDIRHELDRRPADAGDDWYIGCDGECPRLTTRLLRRVIQAATGHSPS